MKTMKKLASIALALVMALALAVPAMAAETGTITITNANMSESYTAYKILEATIGNGSISYTAAEGWAGFLATETAKAVLAEAAPATDPVSYTTANPEPDELEAFAAAAVKYATEKGIIPAGISTKIEETNTVTVVISGLEPGYYAIDSTMGTVCMLQTAGQDLEIEEKNVTVPTPKKEQDTSEITKGVGDVINYTVTMQVVAGAENYVLHDAMSAGLTYNEDVAATATDDEGKETDVTLSVATEDLHDSTCTFEATIMDVADYVGQTITFTYTATINEYAVTTNEVTNSATVSYGNGSTTTADVVSYKLYSITVNKWALDAEGNRSEENLEGAQFKLYDALTDGSEIAVIYDEDSDCYRPVVAGEAGGVIEAGTATIKGLKAGTYYLEEVEAPEGYNALAARQMVEIGEELDGIADVDNQTGATLPSTGGIGTTIFYVGGSILVVGAAILLITKKRMGSAD